MVRNLIFIFLVNPLFFAFQAEGMFLEHAALKATRCITRANVLTRGFKSASEELSKCRVTHPKFSEEKVRPFQFLSGNSYRNTQSRKPFNWLFLAASGSALAAVSYNKVFAKSEPQGDLREDELEDAFLTGYEKAQAIKKQNEVVFVLGNAGAGKSTFIVRLMEAKTHEYKDKYGQKTIQIEENPDHFPKIGYDSYESKTVYPELWFADDLALCDCPGFQDSRGDNYQFVENVCLEYALRSTKRKKFILIVAEDTITVGRGASFKEFIRHLSNFLTRKEDFNGVSSRAVLDSIVWIITKAPPERTPQGIRNIIEILGKRNTGAKEEKERTLLTSIRGENTFLIGSFDRERIISHIKELQTTSETEFSVVDLTQKQKFVNLALKVFQEAFSLDEGIKNSHLSKPDDLQKNLNEVLGEKIKGAQKKKEECVRESNKILEQLKRLEQNKKEMLVWDYTQSEERSWGSLSWSVFDFKYTEGKPFTRVEVEKDGYSSEYNRKEDGEKGIFEAQYKGGMGQQCRVTVRLFKEDPEFMALKKVSTGRLEELQLEIKDIEEKEIILESLKIAVERGEIEEAQNFLSKDSGSEQELMKSVKTSEGIRAELERKVKIGYALLEMDPGDLSHHPLAEQFLSQFKQ